MKTFFEKLLKTFDFDSWNETLLSFAPSLKYHLSFALISVSSASAIVDRLLGLDWLAFLAFLVIMITELFSGIYAAHIKGEPISSMKLSRFTFKVAYYLVLMAVPYLFAQSYRSRDEMLVAEIFDWTHKFLTVQIVMENIISILENAAVIQGKDKTHWIKKLQEKINTLSK